MSTLRPVFQHVPALDGLRGLAVLLVLTHHIYPYRLKGGFLGVDLFFVLSGFLITSLLLRERERAGRFSLRRFYARRVLRLGPALLLNLFVCLLVVALRDPASFAGEAWLVLMTLLYATNWLLALGRIDSYHWTSITWSLSIEEQFYLVWPLALLLLCKLRLSRRMMLGLLGALVGAVIWRRASLLLGGEATFSRLYYATDTRADALLMGCVAALVSPALMAGPRARLFLRLLGGAAVALICFALYTAEWMDRALNLWGYTALAALMGVVIWSTAYAPLPLAGALLEWRPLRWFGDISYGLYLWHWPVLMLLQHHTRGTHLTAWLCFAISVACAALSYYLVERPFLRFKSRFAAPEQTPDEGGRTGPVSSPVELAAHAEGRAGRESESYS